MIWLCKSRFLLFLYQDASLKKKYTQAKYRDLEETIENDYIEKLQVQCYRERQHSKLIWVMFDFCKSYIYFCGRCEITLKYMETIFWDRCQILLQFSTDMEFSTDWFLYYCNTVLTQIISVSSQKPTEKVT